MKNILLWSLSAVTTLFIIGGLIILGGCAQDPVRKFAVRIDGNGNLATMECVGECLFLEFDEIVPASTQ